MAYTVRILYASRRNDGSFKEKRERGERERRRERGGERLKEKERE